MRPARLDDESPDCAKPRDGRRTEALLGADGARGMEPSSPVWHFVDPTPSGRGDFMPKKHCA